MRPAPMTWRRVWTIVRAVQDNRIVTPGQLAYLDTEIRRMDSDQRRRFIQETSGNMTESNIKVPA